jgi:hypothetical protein
MKELPDERTLDRLIELAKDFEQKTKDLYDLSTEIDDKWRIRLESKRRTAIQQVGKTEEKNERL